MPDNCLICQRVKLATELKNPWLIHEFRNSYFVIGDHQYFKGYSLLLLKEHVRELHDLPEKMQQELFQELMAAGRAVYDAYRPWKLNYSCYGNAEPHVHWHIFPRYESEPDFKNQPWLHSADFKDHLISDEKAAEHIKKIREQLKK